MGELQALCMGCACISATVLIIMLALGFSSLSTNQYGLNYSWVSETIEDFTYTQGIYFLGISHEFIKFPKSVITVDFSSDYGADYPAISSRTSDGLEVDIEVSFQYTLDPQYLHQMYYTFNTDYQRIFDLVAIDVLTTNTTEYSAYNFFWNRQQISDNMQAELNHYFEKWCFAQIQFFQLRTVSLPQSFEDSIQKTEVTKQSIQQAEAQKNKTQISFQTEIMKAQYQKNVTVNLAEGDALQILNSAKAQANVTKTVQGQNAKSYSNLKKTLNMDSQQLIQFLKNKLVLNSAQPTIAISDSQNVCGNNNNLH